MISLCVIPNMKWKDRSEKLWMIISCVCLDAIYMVPMIANAMGAK